MPIVDRTQINNGTILVGHHHGATYRAEVIRSTSIRRQLRFTLITVSDGPASLVGAVEYSPSGLARRITGGPVNGWRFWSIEGAEREQTAPSGLPRTGRRFGVEIEFCGSSANVIRCLREHGIRASSEGYSHRTPIGEWKLSVDGSVNPGGNELISPILQGEDGFDQIRKVCAALKDAGAYVNETCGFHVHHDMRGAMIEEIRRVVRWYFANQETMAGFTAQNRRANHYCRFIDSTYLNEIAVMVDTSRLHYIDRYYNLNVNCFPRDGSIEFRQHQGTINPLKMINWIRFGQAIIDTAINQEEALTYDGVAALLSGLVSLADNVRGFFTARAANFAALQAAA